MNRIQYPFTNYLVFPKVMEDEEICRGILQLIFPDKKIGRYGLKVKTTVKKMRLMLHLKRQSMYRRVCVESEWMCT